MADKSKQYEDILSDINEGMSEIVSKYEQSKGERPPIAAKAYDLDALKKVVEDAAAVSGPLWVSYLFVMFYIALAAAGVSHVDLLLENPVELPFLNIKLALTAFFILAPILFVISHAYTMAHFLLLADKARRFHQELHRQISGVTEDAINTRSYLRRQLPSNIFVQFLAGPEDLREGMFGILLKMIAWATLAVGPVLLLLLIQLQFLPYHDDRIIWLHRLALAIDLFLIWWLWRKILTGRSGERKRTFKSVAASTLNTFFSAVLTVVILTFSFCVATFPGERRVERLRLFSQIDPHFVRVRELVFGATDPFRPSPNKSWPANVLQLSEFNIYAGLKAEDPTKLDWKEHTFDLRDRHFEETDFSGARLEKVDFRNAHLEGANFLNAQLQEATLLGAHLEGAQLAKAKLHGALLVGAYLQGAHLAQAQLIGAILNLANLQGADLEAAQLQGASIDDVNLQGASLDRSQLQGTSMMNVQLQGASLQEAEVAGSALNGLLLWRSNFPKLRQLRKNAARNQKGPDFLLLNATWAPVTFSKNGAGTFSGWNDATFNELVMSLKAIPSQIMYDKARDRIARLECNERNLPPCSTNKADMSWEKIANSADSINGVTTIDDSDYQKGLASVFKEIICENDINAIHVLRGLMREDASINVYSAIAKARDKANSLIDSILNDRESCPISQDLNRADRATLLKIKRWANAPEFSRGPLVPPPL